MTGTGPRRLLGYLGATGSPALFDRPAPLLWMGGAPCIVRRWRGAEPEGQVLAEAEWLALLASGEASPWPLDLPGPGAWWPWVVHRRFGAEIVELERQLGGGLGAWLDRGDGARVLLVDEAAVGFVRGAWSQEAVKRAEIALRRGEADKATHAAEMAWLMAREVSPAHAAVRIGAFLLEGQEGRAAAFRAMVRNSWGAAFADSVEERVLPRVRLAPRPVAPWTEDARASMEAQLHVPRPAERAA